MDIALIELYNTHKKCRAPIHLFDRTIKWVLKFGQYFFENTHGNKLIPKKVPLRNTFIKQMYEKVHSKKNKTMVLPKIVPIPISPSMSIPTTLFDFRTVLADMLCNDDIMDNLLFYDYTDPTKIHPGSSNVGEIITSDVFLNTAKRLCTDRNKDVLFPIIMYNDEVNLDVNGKLQLDPLSFTFGRLPLEIRNQPNAWRFLGFLNHVKQYQSNIEITSKFKMEVIHKCLEEMFRSIKSIQKSGGIPFDLKLKNGTTHNVVLKVYLQFVIGDTKGHNMLCCKKDTTSLKTPQLVRDCCVSPEDSDKPYHQCKFRTKSYVNQHKLSKSLDSISFHDVQNAFEDMDMGDNIHGIYGGTCGEPLHIFEMQLLELLTGVFNNTLSSSSSQVLQKSIIHLVPIAGRNSLREEYFCLSAFREGLTTSKLLTGRERQARLFVIYLALMCSDCSRMIIDNSAKNDTKDKPYGRNKLQKWLNLIEDSLIFMKWIRKKEHKREDLYNPEYWKHHDKECDIPVIIEISDEMTLNSPAQNAVSRYLMQYKKLVKRNEGNELKIPKYHIVIHIPRNIIRHGGVQNYDGSRPESIAKDIAKSPGLRTQKQHKSFCYQTAVRYHEDLTVAEAERLFNHQSDEETTYSYFSSSGVNKSESVIESIDNEKEFTTLSNKFRFQGSNFSLFLRFTNESSKSKRKPKENISEEDDNNIDDNDNVVIVSRVIWNGKKIPAKRIDDHLLQCITNWLWIDTRGGIISKKSIPKFYTQMNFNGHVLNCHPDFRNESSSNDWVYVNWGCEYDEPLPARLHMLFDISDCDIINDSASTVSNNYSSTIDTTPMNLNDGHNEASQYLNHHKKWAVVHSAVDEGYLHKQKYSKYQLQSKIARRIEMEKDKYRVIPVTDIVGRAFAIANYIPFSNSNNQYDNTAIVIDPSTKWESYFINVE